MKENTLTFKDKNGKKKEYRILSDIKTFEDGKNYLIYTDDSKTDDDKKEVHALSYILSSAGNITKVKSLENDEYLFIERMLSSVESE